MTFFPGKNLQREESDQCQYYEEKIKLKKSEWDETKRYDTFAEKGYMLN